MRFSTMALEIEVSGSPIPAQNAKMSSGARAGGSDGCHCYCIGCEGEMYCLEVYWVDLN